MLRLCPWSPPHGRASEGPAVSAGARPHAVFAACRERLPLSSRPRARLQGWESARGPCWAGATASFGAAVFVRTRGAGGPSPCSTPAASRAGLS